MPSLNILISGSGIAGSVFAFWLIRAYPDANITIVERDTSLRLTGASIDIRSSAVDVIKWMGLEAAIRGQATNEEGMQLVSSTGSPIATLKATGREDVQSFTSEFEIFRGALAKIFIDPLIKDSKVKLIFDESVDHFEQVDDQVVVTFSKSKEVATYDFLIAADGLNSKIRGKILNSSPSEQLYDEGVHVAYFTIPRDLLLGSRLAKGYNATGGRVVYLRPDPDPRGRTRAMLMNVTTKSDVEMKERLNRALREGNESCMQLMEELFANVGWLVPEVLRGMRESDDFYYSLFGQIRAPKLHDGRVVLLGDAGYATPGFGTSLAISGGYVLAGELLNHPGDIATALRRYEDIMLPFAKSNQGGEGAMQWVNPQTWWGIGIRNWVFWGVTATGLDKLVMMMAAKLGFTEKKCPMPDYQWPAE
jgi:2-polyprenyl-6-methoxyphenol hydroxylase-like FAD-dependent oxidoreductase